MRRACTCTLVGVLALASIIGIGIHEDYRNIKRFRNVLTASQSACAMSLLAYFDTVMRENGIDYIVDGGTLIGTTLHHDRIPWDDDFDVYIRKKDKKRATSLLSQDGYVMRSVGLYSKLWAEPSASCPRVANHRAHNWPFVDVGWLEENATHMWETRSLERRYRKNVYNKSWLFPSTRRLFGNITLSAPRDSHALLTYRFGSQWHTVCVANHYNHILETWRYLDAEENTYIPCARLARLNMITLKMTTMMSM